MIKMIATDLDGTLLHPKRPFTLVSKQNIKFLQGFGSAGGKVTLITGRSTEFCQKISKKLKVPCDIISYTGSVIIKDGKVYSEEFIPFEVANELHKVLDSAKFRFARVYMLKDKPFLSNGFEYNFFVRFIMFLMNVKKIRYYDPIKFSKKYFKNNFNETGKVCKMMVLYFKSKKKKVLEELDPVFKKYSDVLEFQISQNCIEITKKGCNKGERLEELVKSYEIENHEVAVVGDDGNDISMFEKFPNSFAIKSGTKELQEIAKYKVKNISELAKYLTELNVDL